MDINSIDLVDEFHRTFELDDYVDQEPHVPTDRQSLLRMQCLNEEVAELAHALLKKDIVGVLDALTDIQYFLDGTYLLCGLQHLKMPAMNEVHRSNMTKLDAEGRPVKDEAGRVMKSELYEKPMLQKFF